MARKTSTFTVQKEGRDNGKVFVLEELPAAQAERWAMRAFLALAKSGVNIPDDIARRGLAGVAMLGLQVLCGLSFTDAEPLLFEIMRCAQYVPDPTRPAVTLPYPQFEGQVEEVETLLDLRMEVLKLHIDFFTIAARLKSRRPTSPTA
jgi:hypothetical protein